jgi:hypothetical protein
VIEQRQQFGIGGGGRSSPRGGSQRSRSTHPRRSESSIASPARSREDRPSTANENFRRPRARFQTGCGDRPRCRVGPANPTRHTGRLRDLRERLPAGDQARLQRRGAASCHPRH